MIFCQLSAFNITFFQKGMARLINQFYIWNFKHRTCVTSKLICRYIFYACENTCSPLRKVDIVDHCRKNPLLSVYYQGNTQKITWSSLRFYKSRSDTLPNQDNQGINKSERGPDRSSQRNESTSLLAELLMENTSPPKEINKSLQDIEKEINELLLSSEERDVKIFNKNEITDSEETVLEYLKESRESSSLENDDDEDNFDFIEEIKLPSKHVEALPFTAPSIHEHLPPMYGTPDPSIPATNVPCAGCGALLHCQDPAAPGYMPSEVFKPIKYNTLWEKFCLRCTHMQQHKECLNVNVTAEEYRDVIATVKNERALVLVVVDVTDIPNSIFPNLSELVGNRRPLFIIGNKIDLIPKDSTGYLHRIKVKLTEMSDEVGLTETNFVKHVCLVSSKTGYGIEELITKLLHIWERKGHVYILGCTNAGKSSLFNALLKSDFCNSNASDIIQRATVSVWPGTTLNLLKFPIIDPTPWRLHKRVKRLLRRRTEEAEEAKLRKSLAKETTGKERRQFSTLKATIGRTNFSKEREDDLDSSDPTIQATYNFNRHREVAVSSCGQEDIRKQLKTSSFNWAEYRKSRWCYDTPGVINPQQVINYLSQSELEIVQPPSMMQPRTFIVKPGHVIFISGLGKIYFWKGPAAAYFTVFASSKIPVHVVNATEEENFYHENIGTKVLGVPLGDSERLAKIPPLAPQDFEFIGITWQESVADIILSSIGWVAVTGGRGMEMKVRAFTPGGLGCRARSPPLLPFAVNQRGKRIRGTPAYRPIAPML